MFIPEEKYKEICESVIIICTDIVIRHKNKFLLIKRNEEPMRGVYWPIGGRVYMGETAEQAARRKIIEELCLIEDIRYIRMFPKGEYEERFTKTDEFNSWPKFTQIGYYEDQYKSNSFNNNTVYCTLSIVFECEIETLENIKLDKTSDDWGLFDKLPERFKVKGGSAAKPNTDSLDRIQKIMGKKK